MKKYSTSECGNIASTRSQIFRNTTEEQIDTRHYIERSSGNQACHNDIQKTRIAIREMQF